MVHRVEDLPLPGELHRRLSGVDVHIHGGDGQRYKQHAAGELPLHDLVAVSLFQRRRQELGLNEAAVDEEGLHGAAAPAQQRLGDKAGNADLAAPALHLDQALGKLPAQGGVDGGFQLPVAGGVEAVRAVLHEAEGDIGVRQGKVLHESRHSGGLSAVLTHKFESCGGVVEQIPDGDGGALRRAGGLHLTGSAALQAQYRAGNRALLPRQDLHAADGGDRRQRFAAKAQGADGSQVLRLAQLTRCVAQKGGGQFFRSDAAAVVRHADEAHAAPLDFHHDGRCARVDGVFHQLFHNAGRALHHLAGGDEVGNMRGELLDIWHGDASLPRKITAW